MALSFFGATQANAASNTQAVKSAWAGQYQGELPCADCSDVSYTVSLLPNNTFKENKIYQGTRNGLDQAIVTQGTFTWNENKTKLKLSNGDQYQVSANAITMLDNKGQLVTGLMGALYVFDKLVDPASVTHPVTNNK